MDVSLETRTEMDTPPEDLTRLLQQWGEGRQESLDLLLPQVYAELKRQAARYLRRERRAQSLQATALVHEAFLKLVDQRDVRWQSRAHFFGIAARLMRQILVDHARSRAADKRGGGEIPVALDEELIAAPTSGVDVLALDQALTRLEAVDPQQSRIVELKFFAGLTLDEIAEVMHISAATVSREWTVARAWLFAALEGLPR